MKKVFKSVAILAATAAVGTGVAFASGCGGSDGKYIGYYAYENYNQVYGMVVEVTVENNIITKVVDVTKSYKDDAGKGKISYTLANGTESDNTAWHTYSAGWEEYFKSGYGIWIFISNEEAKAAYQADNTKLPKPSDCNQNYEWYNSDVENWTNYEAWALQQYEGWSVADMLDLKINIKNSGEPYETKDGYNADFAASGLVISHATQSCGRLALAVQNALGKTVEIGRVESGN